MLYTHTHMHAQCKLVWQVHHNFSRFHIQLVSSSFWESNPGFLTRVASTLTIELPWPGTHAPAIWYTELVLLPLEIVTIESSSLVPSSRAPPSEKQSGEQSWTSWAYSQDVVRTQDPYHFLYNIEIFISTRVSIPFLSGFETKCFEHC